MIRNGKCCGCGADIREAYEILRRTKKCAVVAAFGGPMAKRFEALLRRCPAQFRLITRIATDQNVSDKEIGRLVRDLAFVIELLGVRAAALDQLSRLATCRVESNDVARRFAKLQADAKDARNRASRGRLIVAESRQEFRAVMHVIEGLEIARGIAKGGLSAVLFGGLSELIDGGHHVQDAASFGVDRDVPSDSATEMLARRHAANGTGEGSGLRRDAEPVSSGHIG